MRGLLRSFLGGLLRSSHPRLEATFCARSVPHCQPQKLFNAASNESPLLQWTGSTTLTSLSHDDDLSSRDQPSAPRLARRLHKPLPVAARRAFSPTSLRRLAGADGLIAPALRQQSQDRHLRVQHQHRPACCPLQASEQYFTTSQSFSHFLRHSNERPHVLQIFALPEGSSFRGSEPPCETDRACTSLYSKGSKEISLIVHANFCSSRRPTRAPDQRRCRDHPA